VSAVVTVPAPVLAPEFAWCLVPQPGELATRAVDEAVEEEFLALICADEDLLRAQFDAIIAASWDQPASPQRPGHARPPAQHPQGPGWISGSPGGVPGPPHEPGAEGRSRQRAPPELEPPEPATNPTMQVGGEAAASTINSGDHAPPGSPCHKSPR
jgi:hypothetical protein